MISKIFYKRIIIKISGELLSDKTTNNIIDIKKVVNLCKSIKLIYDLGIEIAIVIGGGNIFRGSKNNQEIERTSGDFIGMLSTVINGIIIRDNLKKINIKSKLQTAFSIHNMEELFIKEKAIYLLKNNIVIIFVGGIGNPYFSTDTTAVLRANEIDANLILKITKVDGVYDKDPILYGNAKKYETLSFEEIINKQLKIMDINAFCLSLEKRIPILVLNLKSIETLVKKLLKNSIDNIGTLIK